MDYYYVPPTPPPPRTHPHESWEDILFWDGSRWRWRLRQRKRLISSVT